MLFIGSPLIRQGSDFLLWFNYLLMMWTGFSAVFRPDSQIRWPTGMHCNRFGIKRTTIYLPSRMSSPIKYRNPRFYHIDTKIHFSAKWFSKLQFERNIYFCVSRAIYAAASCCPDKLCHKTRCDYKWREEEKNQKQFWAVNDFINFIYGNHFTPFLGLLYYCIIQMQIMNSMATWANLH